MGNAEVCRWDYAGPHGSNASPSHKSWRRAVAHQHDGNGDLLPVFCVWYALSLVGLSHPLIGFVTNHMNLICCT